MRRYLTLVFMVFLAIPAGISFSGCTRNPAGNYCNGLGYGLKDTDVYAIDLEPKTTGVSLAFGQTRQINAPTATTCKGTSASVSSYTYATTNNQLVDISPTGNMCAGTWNRNSGGGIPDYTICNLPNPLPNTGGLPYAIGLHFRLCQFGDLESRAGVCACAGEFGHSGATRERGPAMLFPGRQRAARFRGLLRVERHAV